MQPQTVAIIGEQDRSWHLAAISQSPRLELSALAPSVAYDGQFAGRVQGTSHRIVEDPQELLAQGCDVLVVCTPPGERAYWIEAGLGAGHWVVTPLVDPLPLPASTERLLVEAPLNWTAAREQVERRAQTAGPIRYIRARLRIPADWLVGEGVLVRWGAFLPLVLQRTIGTIDMIRATTNNHRHSGPWEDHALALVSFTNGTEGTIEIDALGGQAEWQVELIGDEGPALCYGDLHAERGLGLARLYESLAADTFAAGSTDAHEALFLAHWIRQSGRLDRNLSRREARRR